MTIDISFLKSANEDTEIAVYPIGEDKEFSARLAQLDKDCGGFVTRAIDSNKSFAGKFGQTLSITLPVGAPFNRCILLGFGGETTSSSDTENAGSTLYSAIEKEDVKRVAIFANCANEASRIACGFSLRAWRFDEYKTIKENAKRSIQNLDIIVDDINGANTLWGEGLSCEVAGVYTARDLISHPPNVLYPQTYADKITALLKPLGVEVEVLDEKRMAKLGMGSILAVGQGSARPPRLVVMKWSGDKTCDKQPMALVGKGITFDTGGISIKPSAKMDEMKADMGGSAAVVGAMEAIARSKLKTNVVAAVALAENMPSSTAYLPADIITTLNGKTVEVLNTDAEGRLVLIDALTYVQREYSPRAIVDVATLTGAIVVALGEEYAGAFVNDDEFWGEIEQSSKVTSEKLWRMPLDKAFREQVESDIADLQNIGKIDRAAGSCTAAAFLQHFVENDTPWAHLDIAGVGLFGKARPSGPKGATGFGVRLLTDLVKRKS